MGKLMVKVFSLVADLAMRFCQGNRGAFASMAAILPPVLHLRKRLDPLQATPIVAGVLNLFACRKRGKVHDAQVQANGLLRSGQRGFLWHFAGERGIPLVYVTPD